MMARIFSWGTDHANSTSYLKGGAIAILSLFFIPAARSQNYYNPSRFTSFDQALETLREQFLWR
jgi:hypothetical protein